MKHIFFFLIFISIFISIQSFAANYNLLTCSYLGGTSNSEAINGVQIQSDGTIVLAGNISLSTIGAVSSVNLNGASSSSLGTIVRLGIDGKTVKSVTKVGADIADMMIDGNDNIYVALKTEGAIKLNSTASSVIYKISDLDVYRLDAGKIGYCAYLGGVGEDFGGYHKIRLYDQDGNLILDRYTANRCLDIAVSEENQVVVYSGFNMYFQSSVELHMTFYEGIGFNGAVLYNGYNWTDKDWVSRNWGEQTRGNVISIGEDGYLYQINTWTGKGYNCLERDPFIRSQFVNQVKVDKYMNIDNMRWGEEGDSKKKLFIARYNINNGQYIKGVAFANAASQGPGTITVSNPGSLMVDEESNLYFAGSSAALFPVPPEYTPQSGEEAINPTNNVYCGNAILAVLNNDLNKRLFAASLDGNKMNCIASRTINNTKIIVAGGVGNNKSYKLDALQSTLSGTTDAYFAVINSPGTTTIPTAPSALSLLSNKPSKIIISWTDNSNNEDGFIIQRKTASGSFVQVAKLNRNKTTFHDISIKASTSYIYRIAAYNLQGNSSFTNELNVSTGTLNPPSSPSNLVGKSLNQSQVLLTWNDVSGEDGYLIEQKKEGELQFSSLAQLPANQLNHTITNLLAGANYEYRIRAYNEDGYSNYSSTVSVKTVDLYLHDAISPLNISQGLCYELFLHTTTLGIWPDFSTLPIVKTGTVTNLNVDDSRDTFKTDYDIRYSGYIDIPIDGTYTFTNISHKGAMLFIDDSMVIDNSTWKWGSYLKRGQIGLKQGKHKFIVGFYFTYAKGTYNPRLEMYIEGPSLPYQLIPDNMLSKPNACDITGFVPAAPSNVTYEILAGNIVKISWDDNSNNESAFLLEHTPYDWNTYDAFKEMVRVGANETSFIFMSLKPDSIYNLRIRALNAYGYSAYSEVLVFTPTGAVSNKPAYPDQLDVSFVSETQVSLIWRDNSFNEDAFVVEYREGGSGAFVNQFEVAANVNSATIENLKANTLYTFRVYSKNIEGISAYSNEVQATTLVTELNLVFSNEISIYPTIASDYIMISCRNELRGSLGLYNSSGMLVKNWIIPLPVKNIQLITNDLPAGLYILIGEGIRRKVILSK